MADKLSLAKAVLDNKVIHMGSDSVIPGLGYTLTIAENKILDGNFETVMRYAADNQVSLPEASELIKIHRQVNISGATYWTKDDASPTRAVCVRITGSSSTIQEIMTCSKTSSYRGIFVKRTPTIRSFLKLGLRRLSDDTISRLMILQDIYPDTMTDSDLIKAVRAGIAADREFNSGVVLTDALDLSGVPPVDSDISSTTMMDRGLSTVFKELREGITNGKDYRLNYDSDSDTVPF